MAPDDGSVVWATGCGATLAQSEMETWSWTNQQETLNVPKHDPTNKSSHSLNTEDEQIYTNNNNQNIHHSKTKSDIFCVFITYKQMF